MSVQQVAPLPQQPALQQRVLQLAEQLFPQLPVTVPVRQVLGQLGVQQDPP